MTNNVLINDIMGYPSLIIYQIFGLADTVSCRFHNFLFIKLVYDNDATRKAKEEGLCNSKG